MKVLFFFIDGFGIGQPDSSFNPIYAANTPCFDWLWDNGQVIPTDSCLGVPGLPQSATGQTTLLTGINASAAIGRHLNGFPTASLRKLIEEHSLLKELRGKGYRVTNANMYTSEYLETLYGTCTRGPVRMSATTVATMAADIPFRTEKDLLEDKAVYQDITNRILIERGLHLPLREPKDAGKVLAHIAKENDFTLFEYFQTDIAGHSTDMGKCVQILEKLDIMMQGVVENTDFSDTILLITSDHGNIEDLRVRTHTTNPVPTILMGRSMEYFATSIACLTDVAGVCKRIITEGNQKSKGHEK